MTELSHRAQCEHRNVVGNPDPKALTLIWLCCDCNRQVKPAAFVLVEQPLPDELSLMDFAARYAEEPRSITLKGDAE